MIMLFMILVRNCGPQEYNHKMFGVQPKFESPVARFMHQVVISLGPT